MIITTQQNPHKHQRFIPLGADIDGKLMIFDKLTEKIYRTSNKDIFRIRPKSLQICNRCGHRF
jgi:hypothetical protein